MLICCCKQFIQTLFRNLQNGKGTTDGKIEGLDKDKKSLDVQDYALHEALNLLKGISIIKK